MNTEPSGKSVAEEWYNRGTVDADNPSLVKREPLGASGLYIKGAYMGSVAYECPTAQVYSDIVSKLLDIM